MKRYNIKELLDILCDIPYFYYRSNRIYIKNNLRSKIL